MKLRNKKTGEIVIARKIGFEIYSFNEYTYNSIAELNEEWEDYVPKEPLIKDEKIRKAVRAWADAGNVKLIKYSIAPNEYYDADLGTGFSIKFTTKPIEVYLEEHKDYTITELCGEEEE